MVAQMTPDRREALPASHRPKRAHDVGAATPWTLRMPNAEIVGEGVRLAIEFARNPAAPRHSGVTVMAPSLIVRQSTAPPAGRAG
jgi:hypothetical protein